MFKFTAAGELQSDKKKILYTQQSGGHPGKGVPSSHTAGEMRRLLHWVKGPSPPTPCNRTAGMSAPGVHTVHSSKTLKVMWTPFSRQVEGALCYCHCHWVSSAPLPVGVQEGGTEGRNKDSRSRVRILILWFGHMPLFPGASVFSPVEQGW